MGLLDKLAAKMAARGPDHGALLTEALGVDDPYVAHGSVVAAAFKRGGGNSNDFASKLLVKAVDVASTKISESRHIGGEPGTIARSLPQEGDMLFAALSAHGVSMWSFGMLGTDVPPRLVYRFAGDRIASVQETGQRAQGGAKMIRFTFSDDSFFDYRLMVDGTGLLDACAERWPV
jgi:hypothetical protein